MVEKTIERKHKIIFNIEINTLTTVDLLPGACICIYGNAIKDSVPYFFFSYL